MKKEKFKKIILNFKNAFLKFPVTMISIFALTIFLTIFIDTDLLKENSIGDISLFFTVLASSCFTIETIIKRKNKILLSILYIVSLIISILSVCLINFIQNQNLWITRIIISYILSLIAFSIYMNYKKSKKTFQEYLTIVTVNAFKASIVYGLLAIGLLLVSTAFVVLLIPGFDFDLIYRVQILLYGLYFVPSLIYSLCNTEIEIGKFSKAIIKCALDGLVFASFLIIYAYIIKIIILRQMPSNQVFRIISSLFILGCPIWTMASYFKDNDFFEKVNNKLPICFIPFIFLQIYSIGVRIYNNGLTEMRYVCVMLIIFEIIYILIYLIKKNKIGESIIAIIILMLITMIFPYINMFKLSEISQYNILKIVKTEDELNEKEKAKVRGAYKYLSNRNTSVNLEEITDEEKKKFSDSSTNGNEKLEKSISTSKAINEIDTKEYNKLYIFSESNYRVDEENKTIEEVFDNFILENGTNINLTNSIKNYISNQSELKDYFTEHNEIQIDENTKVILKSLAVRYDEIGGFISSYTIKGYLLIK